MVTLEATLIESFLLLNRFFQAKKIRYCLIGGMAAGYWGVPRYTKDMDFTLVSRTGSFKEIIDALEKKKFKVHEKGPSQIQVIQRGKLTFQADLILAETDYQDWVVQRAIPVKMFDITVPICSPEDLIILKLIANRRQDLLDIENILGNPNVSLDTSYLGEWLKFWELEGLWKKEFGNFPLVKNMP